MARLTLSEQLLQAQATIATQLQALENQQKEVAELRAGISHLRESIPVEVTRAVTANAAILQATISELEKKIKDKDNLYSYQSANLLQAQNEIEQAHAVLDGVEGAPGRDYEKEGGYGKTQRNVVTRLAGAFLAIARNGSVK